MEVKGSMMLRINDPAKSQCSLKLNLFEDPNVQYMVMVYIILFGVALTQGATQTHPKVDKQSFLSESVLKLREGSGGFPVGQSLGILKWRYASKEEARMPLTGEDFFHGDLKIMFYYNGRFSHVL